MIEFIKVTAKTPYGDMWSYSFMGDLDNPEDQIRLAKFMMDCCDDCADRFGCPDEWNPDDWRQQTAAMWEDMTNSRKEYGPPVEYDPFRNVFGGVR